MDTGFVALPDDRFDTVSLVADQLTALVPAGDQATPAVKALLQVAKAAAPKL